ncbi:putative ATP-grasp target RiPP [Nonomuraea sp. M3C6]|uniref:ATP-grasp target RiPP n=1 Tax=Nonomuraea marmarensis TaxID=3351344 RepID=A0ABW7ACK7_9ACTN
MSKIKIDDIAAAGAELNEGDLRLVNGGIRPELSSVKIVVSTGATTRDEDF